VNVIQNLATELIKHGFVCFAVSQPTTHSYGGVAYLDLRHQKCQLFLAGSATYTYDFNSEARRNELFSGSCQKRQKAQALAPQAPIRNRKTRKLANAKVYNRYTNLT